MDVHEIMSQLVTVLDFPVRVTNCLQEGGIKYIHQLAALTESDLMRLPNFGEKSLSETKRVLRKNGLRLDMLEDNTHDITRESRRAIESLDVLDLTRRSSNSLKAKGVKTVAQLVQLTPSDIFAIGNLGKKSLWEISNALSRRGLSLGMTSDDYQATIATSSQEVETEMTPPVPVPPVNRLFTPEFVASLDSSLEPNQPPEMRILEYLAKFTPRDHAVLRDRVFARKRTLEDLARQFRLTRERLRQIEAKLLKRLKAFVNSPEGAPIRAFADSLRKDLGFAVPVGSLADYRTSRMSTTGLSVSDWDLIVEFGLWAAGPYTTVAEWMMSPQNLSAKSTTSLNARLDQRGWLSATTAAEVLAEIGIRQEYHERWILSLDAFIKKDAGWLPIVKTIPSRAEQILRYHGAPMTAAELTELTGCDSERSLRQRLISDGRFKRISRQGHFALQEWPGYEEYSGIAEEIVEEIERQGGEATPQHLIATLAERYGVKPGSVSQYLSAPMFAKTRDGRIRLRRDDEIPRVSADPNVCPALYKIDGFWTLRVEVTAETLRGSGRLLNPAVAVVVGCQPGERRVFQSLRDAIVVSWPLGSATGPNIGSLKPDVDALGGAAGDFLFLTFRNKRIGVRLLRAVELNDLPALAKLTRMVGLPSRKLSSSPWEDIGSAVGLGKRPQPLNPDDVHAALMRRNEVALAQLISDETTASKEDIFKSLESMLGLS